MTTSGLVLTLDGEVGAFADALAALANDSRIELGMRIGNRLPVVTEASGPREAEELLDWIGGLPGVEFVDVTYVDFGSAPDSDAS